MANELWYAISTPPLRSANSIFCVEIAGELSASCTTSTTTLMILKMYIDMA